MQAIENPYASPMFVEPQRGADALRRAAVRIYRVMGWAGVAYVLLVLTVMLCLFAERPARLGLMIGMALECVVMRAFFGFTIKTASRLGVDLDGTYRRARWLAILAASIFFPIRTIPGILAVRRLERYRSHVVEPLRDAT